MSRTEVINAATSFGSATGIGRVHKPHSAGRAGGMAGADEHYAGTGAAVSALFFRPLCPQSDVRRAQLSGPGPVLAKRPAEPDPRSLRLKLRREGHSRRGDR